MANELVDRVRHRLVTEAGDAGLTAAVHAESAGIVDDSVFESLRRDVAAELQGAGPLEPLLAMPGVTDVLVNAADSVWVDRGGGMQRVDVRFADEAAVRRLAQRLAAMGGRRLDDAMPFVDAVLPDGTRLHAIVPPLAGTTTISLRVLARRPLDLAALVALGTVDSALAARLRQVVRARRAFVITGGTGTGKTTLLGALLGEVTADERIVVIEDAAELVVSHPHVVRLASRAANLEGAGAVDARSLVRQALRMRPDRLVVGEFRGAEIAELLVAMNTGHEGGAATLHANSAADVPARCEALGALAGLSRAAVTSLVASAIEVVVHLRRDRAGCRVVSEVGLVERRAGDLVVRPVWTRVGAGARAATAAEEIFDDGRDDAGGADLAGAGAGEPGTR